MNKTEKVMYIFFSNYLIINNYYKYIFY
jgi:hypothetical protein